MELLHRFYFSHRGATSAQTNEAFKNYPPPIWFYMIDNERYSTYTQFRFPLDSFVDISS